MIGGEEAWRRGLAIDVDVSASCDGRLGVTCSRTAETDGVRRREPTAFKDQRFCDLGDAFDASSDDGPGEGLEACKTKGFRKGSALAIGTADKAGRRGGAASSKNSKTPMSEEARDDMVRGSRGI